MATPSPIPPINGNVSPLTSTSPVVSSSVIASDNLSGVGGIAKQQLHAVGAQTHEEDMWGITVRLISANNLKVADMFTRSSDPYAVMYIDNDLASKRTSRIIKHTLTPQWDESLNWVLAKRPEHLTIQLFDWDAVGKHDKLGSSEVPLAPITQGQSFSGELELQGKGAKHGTIKLRIECARVPNVVGRSTAELRGVRDIEEIVSLIDLKVIGAYNLGEGDSHARRIVKGAADPFAIVSYGLHRFKTAVVPHCNNPVWKQVCPLWTVKSDHASTTVLKISVFDHETIGEARLIGNAYLRPNALEQNREFDLRLPLTLGGDKTDAQLSVLLRDLNTAPSPTPSPMPDRSVSPTTASSTGKPSATAAAVHALTAVSAAASAADNAEAAHAAAVHAPTVHPDSLSVPGQSESAAAAASVSAGNGEVHVQLIIKPREQVEREFYSHLISNYDSDGNKSMDLVEVTHMLTALGIKALSEDEIADAYKSADVNGTGLGPAELAQLFRTPAFQKNAALRHLYSVITYGADALDSLLMKGCLTGSNVNTEADADPTVDNEGTKILVQDRESGMVVRENIPAYIKSALVLLNRTWAGKLASARIKGTLRSLTRKAGAKMDSPNSARDIPNFVKIHQLNLDEVELPLSAYKTFNQFFSRRLKIGARTCAGIGDESLAVSPADCRMMVFTSIEESKRLWIKGHSFTVGNLFQGWDVDGSKAAQFNGAALTIARLAPQDYHRSVT
jgi:hypothetical protein